MAERRYGLAAYARQPRASRGLLATGTSCLPWLAASEDGFPIFTGYRVAGFCQEYLYDEPQVVVVARGVGGTGDVRMSPEKSWITNLSIVLSVDSERIDKRFLYYRLGIEPLKDKLNTGAAQAQITIENLQPYTIKIPDKSVQTRIADILSAYDDLIENNRRRMALLEDAARQLYREWFVRLRFPGHEHTPITNGVPEGWEKTNALQAMDVLSGGTPKTTVPDYWDGHIPFYTPKDASNYCYVLETERSITELGLKNCNSRLYPVDTVFISARGTVGKLNLAYRPMAMSQSCYALVGKGHVSQFFLYCALKESIEYLKQHAIGAVFDAIVMDTFKLIPFMVPESKIVRLFQETVTPMFRQVGNLLEQNQKLRTARDLLLPRLMSGEIAV